MKIMFKNSLSIALAWLCSLWLLPGHLGAITVDGAVTVGQNGAPAPFYPVSLSVGANQWQTETDELGQFSFTLNTTTVPGDSAFVHTFDLCTGLMVVSPVFFNPAQTTYTVNLSVCSGIDPPPPPGCNAYFQSAQLYNGPELTVSFFDLSFSALGINSWAWSFGDGATSTESNPTHVYEAPGEYSVVLAVTGEDDCQSTIVITIVVLDITNCECPDELNPVCVATPSGGFIQYDNPCQAQCAGIEPWMYFPCDSASFCQANFDYANSATSALTFQFTDYSFGGFGGLLSWAWDFGDGTTSNAPNPIHTYTQAGVYPVTLVITAGNGCTSSTLQYVLAYAGDCPCPDVWDPVCAFLPDSTLFQFGNACEAACFGFTSDQLQDCGWTCDCPQEIFEPVCAIGPAGDTLHFINPCFAQCEGYFDWYHCDGGGTGCDYPWPVCVACEGSVIQFPNGCIAQAHGYGPEDFTLCDNGGCNCPEYYAPVCVYGPGGLVLTFDNPCFAECEGFGPDQYTNCNNGGCDCPTDEYNPVCVLIDPVGSTIEFPSPCYAECAGFGPDSYVACDSTLGCQCPAIYAPVCVVSADGDVQLFTNACYAECEGFGPEDFVDCGPAGCVCDQVFDPVCAVDSTGTTVTFPNACYAACAGFGPDALVECDDEGCVCPLFYDPVCAIDSNGDTLTFSNACFAACEGYTEGQFIECPTTVGGGCVCPQIYAPVCVLEPGGAILTFTNACYAACEGFGPEDFIECDSTLNCNCDLVFDPVCVADSLGNELHFPNACFAACAGFGPDDFIECNSTVDCNCDLVFDPVCVLDASGAVITFPNACFAACAGFDDPALFVACDSTESCDNCDCPDGLYEPVCVYTLVGPIIFPNTCVALCHGYTEADLTNCFGPEECRVDFFMEFLNENGLEIQFTGLLGGDYPNASWFWEFGDGATSTEPAPVHTYTEPGFYTVVLNVAADSACQATAVYTIVVGDGGVVTSDCQAMFFFEQDPANLATFQFTDMSLGDVATYYWNFGDGASSQEANPVHTYTQPGIYFVTLTIITADDCISSATMLLHYGDGIYYDNTCSALFLPLINSDALSVMCLNLSSDDAVSYAWDFGDGSSSSEFMPMHQYTDAGTYTITLTITTADGCTNTISATINLATGGFTASPTFSIINSDEEVAPETNPVGLFPNPTSETAWLSFRLSAGAAYTVEVLGLDGRRVSRLTGRATGGAENLPIELGGLPGGLYLVRLAGPDGAQTLKLVKE